MKQQVGPDNRWDQSVAWAAAQRWEWLCSCSMTLLHVGHCKLYN